ncbi:hypothetical protein CDL12_24646 [Handroanthus impetiginosus]|uniref:Bidirectional sugar transporter SWEET n=1 Tax=Handroanthus impetiginosus TaxID=429701 RepID=A0A2G9GC19_9LAMI|nr:hypothetical protein CDL12_24646 [Handroanthus impetiginosus]
MDVSVIFGVLGNIVAALLFLSPLNTFWRIVKNRSTEDFESIPYVVLLLNASQWTYYGIIKPVVLLVTFNGFGSLMMIIYLLIFLIFAPPKMKVRTAALVLVVNVGFLLGVILVTSLAMSRQARINVTGTLCDCVTIISFASPLAAMVRFQHRPPPLLGFDTIMNNF